jgi:hypothetical protein
MNVEKSSSSSSHNYTTTSKANTTCIEDIQIDTQPIYDGNLFPRNKKFLLY